MKTNISIIVPTLNEEGNVGMLIDRIVKNLCSKGLIGEIIFVDDHSSDKTKKVILKKKNEFKDTVFIKFFSKKGKKGKAYSLIEGVDYAKSDILAIIDADLQYPPEAIIEMLEKISQDADIVVANRTFKKIGVVHSFLIKSFNVIFAKLLHGLDYDVQSGLKVFRKEIIDKIKLYPAVGAFNMGFLLSAKNYGYKIDFVNIDFEKRKSGKSKINLIKTLFENIWNALILKLSGVEPIIIEPESKQNMRGAGIIYNQKHFITHTTLNYEFSALKTFALWQKIFMFAIVVAIILGVFANPLFTGIIFLAVISTLYFVDMIFNFVLVMRSLLNPPEVLSTKEELLAINDNDLPIYSVFCPLYKEKEVLPHFVEAIKKIKWPKEKLEVLLLFEEDDRETIKLAEEMNLPDFIRPIIVPHSFPKTKPKACNYGLAYIHGEYAVIYDAEDIPDPWQLKKAYLGFKKSPANIICLQAKLNYFNPNQNLLTRLFAAEYSLWFDISLPGLQSINTSIPLGGTSNHFRAKDLIKLKGWDPFNVTEDCDLGVRLFIKGFKTAMIDSVTLEEANSDIKNWLRQRSRWIKGYMQTYLVHMRNPLKFLKQNGWHAVIFQLVVGGKIIFMIINPLLWITTILYFTAGNIVGETIRTLFPIWIFYIAVASLVFGNFLFIYYYMIGATKRGHYQIIKYVFLVPVYWIMVSVAAAIATYQLFVKPYYWEKTNHGLHLASAPQKRRLVFALNIWRNNYVYSGMVKVKDGIFSSVNYLKKTVGILRYSRVVVGPITSGVSSLAIGIKNINEKYYFLIKRFGIFVSSLLQVIVSKIVFTSKLCLRGSVRMFKIPASNISYVHTYGIELKTKKIRDKAAYFSKNIFLKTIAPVTPNLNNIKSTPFFTPGQGMASGFVDKLFQKIKAIPFSNKEALIVAIVVSNFLNFAFNAFLTRKLAYSELALVVFMTTLWYMATIFVGGSSTTINHKVSYLVARQKNNLAFSFFKRTVTRGSYLILFLISIWILVSPMIAKFFQIDSIWILISFSPVILFGFLSSSINGFLKGNLLFGWSAIVFLTEPAFKLLFAFMFVILGKGGLVYLSIPLSLLMAFAVGFMLMKKMPKFKEIKNVSKTYFPFEFFFTSIIATLSYIIFLSVDVIMVKHFFSENMAGQYSIVALSGKMVYFLGTLPLVFLVTFVSRKEGLRESSEKLFLVTVASVASLVVLGVTVFGFFGFFTVPFLFGEKAFSIVGLLPMYVIGIGIFAIANTIVTYHLAKKQYWFTYISLGSSLALIFAIWFFHSTITSVVSLILIISWIDLILLGILHYFEKHIPFIFRSFRDFWGIFVGTLPHSQSSDGSVKKILIFNWRDVTHAYAGGAEIYIHQIAQNWVKKGHEVTIFCGNDGTQKRIDNIDGINIVRRGGFYLVYLWAFLYYIFRFRGKYDLIIDCENGIPFFTPIYASEPVVAVLHHVHQDVFFHSLSKPLALLASFLEKDLMPLVYRRVKFITVSKSSKTEMEKLGIGLAGIDIVYNGVDLKKFIVGKKGVNPSILYLGRLKAYKSVDILIRAFKKVLEKNPNANLTIAGTGDAEKHLRNLSKGLGFEDHQVTFMGRVSDDEKVSLMQKAWAFVNPSFAEGWGVVVIEANACGTPVIASNVAGLRDSVRDNKSGYLVPYGDVDTLANKINHLINEQEDRDKMSEDARVWAENFQWEKSSKDFMDLIVDKERKEAFVSIYDEQKNEQQL